MCLCAKSIAYKFSYFADEHIYFQADENLVKVSNRQTSIYAQNLTLLLIELNMKQHTFFFKTLTSFNQY